MKHIENRMHLLSAQTTISIRWVLSKLNLADILIEPLGKEPSYLLKTKNVVSVVPAICESIEEIPDQGEEKDETDAST